MKSEFALAFTEIGERSKLERSVILEALEAALKSGKATLVAFESPY